jgi:predicted transcriptional regulator
MGLPPQWFSTLEMWSRETPVYGHVGPRWSFGWLSYVTDNPYYVSGPVMGYSSSMETVPVKPERLAQLEDLARRRGKSTADALDDVLADYLEWEQRQDYQEAVQGIRQGYEDVKAGRTKPAEQFLDDFARKHGLPR